MDARRLTQRVNMLGPWLRARHGGPVVKIGLDAGFGCPHRPGGGCSYCPPAGYAKAHGGLSVGEQLARGLERLRARHAKAGRPAPLTLAYFQAHSSTNAPAPLVRRALEQAVGVPGVGGIIVGTRPDCLDEPRWQVLEDAAARLPLWLELGLQSAHDATLAAMNRGHDCACFDQAAAEARRRGLDVVAHVVLGLPGEGRAHTDATAEHLARLGIWGVKLHNLMILEGAALAAAHRAGRLEPWSLEEYARAAASFIGRLPRGTLVHRLAADPGDDTLLAPEWAARKDDILSAIADELERRDIKQGDLCREI